MTRLLLVLFLLTAAFPSCRSDELELAAPARPRIETNWQSTSGRGSIRVFHADGQVSVIKLHEGYGAYTGGLVLGSQDGSAWCRHSDKGGNTASCTALWCAQDESIWLPEQELEYTYGWSENMGTGGDGVPLRYLGGAVLVEAPDELLLTSEHGALPLHVARWLRVRGDGTLLFRVRILNVSDMPVTLDLWSGEDPWVGTYGSAQGDVGWHTGGFVLEERSIPPIDATCLGIADRGAADGRGELVANAFCISQATLTPDKVYFANHFAHSDDELAADTPLSGDTMTAFNVGWLGRVLQPRKGFEVEYAIGEAIWYDAEQVPSPPPLTSADWQLLRDAPPPQYTSLQEVADPLRFASERVQIEILPGGEEVEVRGKYHFENRGDDDVRRRIWFPFAVDEQHPYPHKVFVSGEPARDRLRDGVVFTLEVPAHGELVHEITYIQRAYDGSATYIVTSARAWNTPLDSAELVVVAAPDIEVATTSYPMSGPIDAGGSSEWSTSIERFFPDREFSVTWEKIESANSESPAP